MAYWTRKNGKYVAVYLYENNGKKRALPRSETKHLDGALDSYIDAWVENWEKTNGYEKAPRDELTHGPTLRKVEDYLIFLKNRKKARSTIAWHKQMLTQHVLPYFIHEEPFIADPNQWPNKSIKLLERLQEKGCTESVIIRANVALRSYWEWLCDEGLIVGNISLRLRNPVVDKKDTPLKFTITPDEVLKFIKTSSSDEIKLMALVGFFFSLRPQETFALTRSDFKAGSQAKGLEACKIMSRFDLFDKFAVDIQKQRNQSGQIVDPKSGSNGWVACFNKEAAQLTIDLLKKHTNPKDLLFKAHTNDTWFGKWQASGIPDITLKDLRRASIYWLGHHTDFEPIPLKNHARHSKLDTTLKYLRRPYEELEDNDFLDLEA